MSKVLVLDTNKQPLNPVHPGRARLLLASGKAAVFRRYPFTIILKGAVEHPDVRPLRLKIDPGSQTTGMALVDDPSGDVVFAADLTHRGKQIKHALDQRRAVRRGRRQRNTRYRPPRFHNRRRRSEWLPPSLESRVTNVLTRVRRLARLCPVGAISVERVKFDLQQLEQPEISGIAYQQGTLLGYEVREYLLEKWGRACSYCGSAGVPLQVILQRRMVLHEFAVANQRGILAQLLGDLRMTIHEIIETAQLPGCRILILRLRGLRDGRAANPKQRRHAP